MPAQANPFRLSVIQQINTPAETGQGLAHAFIEMHDHVNHGAYANIDHTLTRPAGTASNRET